MPVSTAFITISMNTLNLFMTLANKEQSLLQEISISTLHQVALALGGFLFIIQFFLFMIYYDFQALEYVRFIGWLLFIPGFLLIMLSRSTLKEYGAPEEGKSWVFSTELVQRGVYSIIRHPFSIGWMIMAIDLALVSQYLLSILCVAIQLPLIAFIIVTEEKMNVGKFETEYINYQKNVPMINLFKGLIRYFLEKRKSLSSA